MKVRQLKREEDFLYEMNTLLGDIAGLTYAAQGIEEKEGSYEAERWWQQRDDAIRDLIEVAQRLKAFHSASGEE